ncbi:unnamed protein product [Effrenium voratum]|nr:unnamed protein product [Effrenium voratum]
MEQPLELAQLLGRIRDSLRSTGTPPTQLFRQLDADHDGFVAARDLQPLLLAFEPRASVQLLSQAFQHFGLDRKPCIGEEDFAAWAERSMDPLGPWNSPGAKEAASVWTGPPGQRLAKEEVEQLLDLMQSHCRGLPLETLDLEFLVPGHSEALWVRQLYWEHYEEHNAAIERLMHQTQSFTKDASYYSLLQEQCETFSSELYIWRVRWPGPAEAIREAARTMRSQLAWHGASGDVDEQSLKQGELRPGRTLALGPWRLASRPLQTFGKGPQWTVFYLCLVAMTQKGTRRSELGKNGHVLPLYCLAHPSIWHSWPCGDWP